MPELPEVQTIVDELNAQIVGSTILSCNVFRPSVIVGSPERFINAVSGHQIKKVSRRGKYLIFDLTPNLDLVGHLKMTGKFTLSSPSPPKPHDRVQFTLDSGKKLVFTDIRCFGKLELMNRKQITLLFNKLGKEPWDKLLTANWLRDRLKNTSIPIKTALLNQSIIAGIGNIYASEILFDAKISPSTSANRLSVRRLETLIASIQKILELALKHNGTTISDYKRVDEKTGGFQDFLKVYGRSKETCRTCDHPVQKINQNQRSTFFCPNCQK